MAKKKTVEPHELRKILRKAMIDSGKTVYQLHLETEIDQGQLHRFKNDETKDMKASSMEKLFRALGLKASIDDSAAN